jgi:hypothetical protein
MKSGKSSEIVMGLIKHTYPNDEVFVGKLRYSIVSSNDGLNSFLYLEHRNDKLWQIS